MISHDAIKYILILCILMFIKSKLIDNTQAIKYFVKLYNMNYTLLDDQYIYILLNDYLENENDTVNTIKKYLLLIHVSYMIDVSNITFVNLFDNSKLMKNQKNKTNIKSLTSCDINDIIENYIEMKLIITYLQLYLASYGVAKKKSFTTDINEYYNMTTINILKNEIIERIELLKSMFGIKFIYFILHKPSRKIKKPIYIHDKEYMELLSYNEIVDYSIELFTRLSENLNIFIKDFEFNKFIKILLFDYIETSTDKISEKFYNQTMKKYIII